jgi:hypothetical protein
LAASDSGFGGTSTVDPAKKTTHDENTHWPHLTLALVAHRLLIQQRKLLTLKILIGHV